MGRQGNGHRDLSNSEGSIPDSQVSAESESRADLAVESVTAAMDCVEMYCLLALREPELGEGDLGMKYLATALVYLGDAMRFTRSALRQSL